MSEMFRPGAGAEYNIGAINEQMQEFRSRDTIPHGEHIDMALAMSDLGGPSSSMLFEGRQGVGKSQVMYTIVGEHHVVDLSDTDSAQSLYGYEKPTTEERKYAQGSIGAVALRNGEVMFGVDEVGHFNARALHRMFNGTGFTIHDGAVRIDTSDMVFIGTTNFPNREGGVQPIRPETRSRFGGGLVFGAEDIEGAGKRRHETGLAAPAPVRREIRTFMEQHKQGASVKPYLNNLHKSLLMTGMFVEPALTGRTFENVLTSVRARRLFVPSETLVTVNGRPTVQTKFATDIRPISAHDVKDVAAFSMGKDYLLNREATRHFASLLGQRTLTEQQKAVISRRLVAGFAHATYVQSIDKEQLVRSGYTEDQQIADTYTHIEELSYASDPALRIQKVGERTGMQVIDDEIVRLAHNLPAHAEETHQTKRGKDGKQGFIRSTIAKLRD